MTTIEAIPSVLSIIGGVVILLNNLVREGVLFRFGNRGSIRLIEAADKIKYDTEEGKNNYRNSLIFKAATGQHAPIHTINQILNCYDPYTAVRIYSKAPSYICFDLLRSPKGPATFERKISRYFSWTVLGAGVLILFLSIGILVVVNSIDTSTQNGFGFLSVTMASFLTFSIISIAFFNYAGSNLIFLKDVDRFYENLYRFHSSGLLESSPSGRGL